jgi:hypothetical protein
MQSRSWDSSWVVAVEEAVSAALVAVAESLQPTVATA